MYNKVSFQHCHAITKYKTEHNKITERKVKKFNSPDIKGIKGNKRELKSRTNVQ